MNTPRTKWFVVAIACLLAIGSTCDLDAAAPDFSPDQIRKILRGRSTAQKTRLLRDLVALPEWDEQQTTALIDALTVELNREQEASPATLMMIWHLRNMRGETVEPLLARTIALDDARAQLLSIDAIGKLTPASLFDTLREQKDSPHFNRSFAYRRGVVDAVAAYELPGSVSFLIDLLPEASGQLERNIVLHLQGLTGQRLTNHPDAWKKWWLTAGTDYRGPPTDRPTLPSDKELAKNWEGAVPEFFDVPLFGDKIVFVIDKSKSMESSVGNETRMDLAQRELFEAIQAMEEQVEFNIIAFDENVDLFQTILVSASSANKENAARYIYSLHPGNKTATFDALAQSLSFDPNTEQLILLSDGRPTAGSILDIDLIIARITELNLFQRTSIDTLGIDTDGETERLMKSLADQNFGTYTKLR